MINNLYNVELAYIDNKIDHVWGPIVRKLRMNFYCSKNPSIAHNLGTTGPIHSGVFSKMYLSK